MTEWRELNGATPWTGVLLIARYPGMNIWSDPYYGWWDDLRKLWCRWPHDFAPTHYMDPGTPEETA